MTVFIQLGSDMLSWWRILWRYWRGRNWWGGSVLSLIDFCIIFHTISTLSTLGGGWRDITRHQLNLHFYEDRSISLLLESKDCVRDYSRTIIKEIPFRTGDFFLERYTLTSLLFYQHGYYIRFSENAKIL